MCLVEFCPHKEGIIYLSNWQVCASATRPFNSRCLAANNIDQANYTFTMVSMTGRETRTLLPQLLTDEIDLPQLFMHLCFPSATSSIFFTRKMILSLMPHGAFGISFTRLLCTSS